LPVSRDRARACWRRRLQLFHRVPGLEPCEHLLGQSQQGVREKGVDFNLKASKDLEGRLVSWQEAPQRLGSPEQQERSRRDLGLGPDEPERAGNLTIGQ
jgi:hypothetical protein